nr:ATP-binding protein [uncultured Desulfobacter sp.]
MTHTDTAARQFEELAERIMTSRFESPSDQSVFYLMIGSSTRHWFSHLKDASQDYQKAYEIGKQYGNLQYAAYAFGHNMYCCFFQGMHLPQLIQDTKQSLVFSKTRLNHWATDLLEGGLSTFEALAEIHVVSEDGKIDDVQYLKQVKENKNIQVLCIYYILKTFYHVLLGNHRHALTLSDEAEQLIYTVGSQGLLPWPEHLCIKFLILTALYEDADTQTQAKWKSELYGIRDKLQLWNENCSENYSHKYLLIQAEIKRIENQQAEAILLYDHAIEAANQNEFVQWEGLANERACHFWSVRQNGYLAQIYWQQAYTCYHKWGANAKINLMENEFRKNLSSWFSDRYQDNTFITIQLDKKRIGFCEKHIKLQKSHSRDKLAFQHQAIVKKEADDLADAINRLRAETAERKRIEQALKESEDKYRQMFEDNTAIKLLIDPKNGDIVDNNSGASNFYGYDHNQFRKMKITDINILSPEEINAEMQKAKLSNRNHFIFKHKLASGEMRDVEVHSGPITYKGRTLLFSIIHDITDRKRMEEQQRQTHKMESIGTLAGGIAHEFNNILSIIIGNNELIMEDLPEWSLSRECADEIRLAGLRARDIVKHLLTFSRQDDSIKKAINIRSVVKESLRLIRSTTPTNIEIRDSFSPDCFPVFGDATQVNQILINLVNNAVYALPISGGRIDIELSNTVIDHMTGFSKNELAPGKYVRLLVRDNGSGMDKEILEKIFEPYFTTKDVNEGSGLGLSVVHGIVENHNGSITCDSKKGQGTTFTILIPAHDGPVETESKQKNTLPGRGESILYIDDEPSIAKLGKRHLQALGYEAFSITNPVEALDMVKSEPNRFDLIISDMAMPKMPGDQLIAEILIIKPDMPTIICTGYSSRISETEAAKMGVKAFLMKPLNKTELAKKVRQVLDDSIENEK